jgi:hypothetical protein
MEAQELVVAAEASAISGRAQCGCALARIQIRYFAEFCLTYLVQPDPLPPTTLTARS